MVKDMGYIHVPIPLCVFVRPIPRQCPIRVDLTHHICGVEFFNGQKLSAPLVSGIKSNVVKVHAYGRQVTPCIKLENFHARHCRGIIVKIDGDEGDRVVAII
jgi:hypothetical protein